MGEEDEWLIYLLFSCIYPDRPPSNDLTIYRCNLSDGPFQTSRTAATSLHSIPSHSIAVHPWISTYLHIYMHASIGAKDE